jgi:hypothetical protein
MQDAVHNEANPGRQLNVQHQPGITAGQSVPQLDINAVTGPGSPLRWRFGPVGDPAQQAEGTFAGLAAAPQDRYEQDKGDGQRDDDVSCG